MYRQGDVLIVPVDEIPEGSLVGEAGERIVLAAGEATGHAHTITSDQVTVWHRIQHDNNEAQIFLQVMTPVDVEHQEHAPITLPPGLYRVVRQREYDPEENRRVAD
ncbi:MAG TPA: hypothetical protein VHP83_04110 [Aggregatilineaceae bacterium]|nr:hypothetical protein [Aggregatilineaceae bacterium]